MPPFARRSLGPLEKARAFGMTPLRWMKASSRTEALFSRREGPQCNLLLPRWQCATCQTTPQVAVRSLGPLEKNAGLRDDAAVVFETSGTRAPPFAVRSLGPLEKARAFGMTPLE